MHHYNCYRPSPVWKWHLLVHVCQRWRQIVLDSPHRLNLQILCTYRTPVRENLDIWPAFPIVLDLYPLGHLTSNDEDNAIAALEHSDRVCSVRLHVTSSQWKNMAPVVTSKPFPILTHLEIHSTDGNAPVLPGGFLGGSAPLLQDIYLHGIPFPALPTLLLSSNDLVNLGLFDIPPTGYISPEAMVACLVVSSNLETFTIEFQQATPHPNIIFPLPTTRGILPALASFRFRGAYKYLEVLVAQIDSPQLNRIFVDYLDQPERFQVTQLSDFIDRSIGAELAPSRRAHVDFHCDRVVFTLYRRADYSGRNRRSINITIASETLDWQFPNITQLLSQFSTLCTVIYLELEAHVEDSRLATSSMDVEWLEFFRQFTAMQILDVSGFLPTLVAHALEDITTEMVPEAFPSLRLIFLEDELSSSVETLIAARRLSDRPVTFVETKAEFKKILKSYMTVSG